MTINKVYKINAPVGAVWKALVDVGEIEGWGAGEAVMDEGIGTNFKLWSGDIWGRNIEVVRGKRLVQEWYGGKWAKPSKVTITVASSHGGTQVTLVHEDVPESDARDIDDGWDSYYFGPMREYLEKK